MITTVAEIHGRRVPVAVQESEVARLEALQRTRALTREESDVLGALLFRAYMRSYHLQREIINCRRRLRELEARAAA